MNEEVTAYIQGLDEEWKIEACTRLRELVLKTVPDATERMQYRQPHYLKNRNYLAVISAAKKWVSFTVFNAQSLSAPDGFFEPDGPPERKTVRVLNNKTIDYDLLGTLLNEAASTL
jgi:hypothetical protein